MAKFKISLEVQGLKLEIEGSREDAPMIANNLGRQFSNLLAPAANIVQGEVVETEKKVAVPQPAGGNPSARRKPRSRRRSSLPGTTDANAGDKSHPIDFRHDVEKFGAAKKNWNTATKAMWLLSVVSQQSTESELSSKQIAETFNKHFRTAGEIRAHNVQRDLGVEKQKSTRVNEDTTQDPSVWFLTESGKKHAASLVAEALGQQSAGGGEAEPGIEG